MGTGWRFKEEKRSGWIEIETKKFPCDDCSERKGTVGFCRKFRRAIQTDEDKEFFSKKCGKWK